MFRILSKFLAIAFFVFPETIVLLLSLPWKLQKSDYGKTIGVTNIPTVISVKWTNVHFFPTILSLLLLALGILITIVALTIMLKVESATITIRILVTVKLRQKVHPPMIYLRSWTN